MLQEQLYHSIFNQLDEILLISDKNAIIVDANVHACDFLEKELNELKGKELSTILSDSSSDILNEALQLKGQEEYTEIDVRLKGFDKILDSFLRQLSVGNDTFWILSAQRLENNEIYTKETSTIDHLTQIYNHVKLEQVLEIELSKSMRYHSTLALSLIILSIDDFKEIVNIHGKKASDKLLIELTKLLEDTIRTSDMVVRWRNSEFIIVVPSNDIFEITTFASKLREIIEGHKYSIGKEVTCSFGVTKYNNEDYKKEQLIERVTSALNKARERGKNRVEVS